MVFPLFLVLQPLANFMLAALVGHSQALDDLHGLREVPLVGYLHHVSPDALVVLGEDRGDVLHGRGARGHGRGVQAVVGEAARAAAAGGGGGRGVAVAADAVGRLMRKEAALQSDSEKCNFLWHQKPLCKMQTFDHFYLHGTKSPYKKCKHLIIFNFMAPKASI